jgi:hypothetical protein
MSLVLLLIGEVMSGVSIHKESKYMEEPKTTFAALKYFREF